jgi:gliding motility-associated lipoprotein GldD
MNKIQLGLILLLASCGSGDDYVPKPHGYPRMVLPAREYRLFDTAALPYSFKIPAYSQMEKDTNNLTQSSKYWYNLNFKPFNATLHITYYKFEDLNYLDSLIFDTRKLVNKHIQRADDITEEAISTEQKHVHGIMFRIEGNTATNLNFYLTDSTHHFFRGALYFNRQTEHDSIAPVYDFIREDVSNLIQSFKWK